MIQTSVLAAVRGLRSAVVITCLLTLAAHPASAQNITFAKLDATVWSHEQVVTGSTDQPQGLLRVGETAIPFTATADAFSVPVRLGEGTTTILACTADGAACPDTLRLTLGYALRPEAELRASVSGRTVTLSGRILANPAQEPLSFAWRQDAGNPAAVALSVSSDSAATFTLPEGAPHGEYYFDWLVLSDDTVRARTFVTAAADSLSPFRIETDHAAWVDSAVIYGVTPYNFEDPGRLANVTRRLPEIAALGVNTLWILPVFSTADVQGPGYWVTDYFQVRSDYGTKEDLRALIAAAHELGLKVILDFVPNHTHVDHPYFRHAAAHGDNSHYYDFFQRTRGNDRYSNQLQTETVGSLTYYRYFWPELPNLNYDNPEVQRHITEAARYWIEEFDVDGYRIDAVWGARARNPEFFEVWRRVLKSVKPEVLLLGEDKAADPTSFDFWDAAYDWYNGDVWISEWGWQPGGHNSPTIFNAAENRRADLLRGALTNKGAGWHPDARVLRFMENNDTQRFVTYHEPAAAKTKMAVALLLSLPGIPLVFNGQEIGEEAQPYSNASYYLLEPGTPIADHPDPHGLYPYYRHLIRLREAFPPLTSDTFAEVPVGHAGIAGKTFAFRRWAGEENAVGVVNMGAPTVPATLYLPVEEMGIEPGRDYYLTDLLSGEALAVSADDLDSLRVIVPGYTTRLFAVAGHVVATDTESDPPGEIASSIRLEQNYPNPFRGRTQIAFELPTPGHVRLAVYDVLGRQVASLADAHYPAGRHTIPLDAHGLPSGLYLYRLDHPTGSTTRTMLLVR